MCVASTLIAIFLFIVFAPTLFYHRNIKFIIYIGCLAVHVHIVSTHTHTPMESNVGLMRIRTKWTRQFGVKFRYTDSITLHLFSALFLFFFVSRMTLSPLLLLLYKFNNLFRCIQNDTGGIKRIRNANAKSSQHGSNIRTHDKRNR